MPVIARFCGIVIRMLCAQSLGARIHAFYGDSELIVGLWPVRVIQGEAPQHVRDLVLDWTRQHQEELLSGWRKLQTGSGAVSVATPH